MFQLRLSYLHYYCAQPSHTPPLQFSHSNINPPRGFQYPGHLPGQSHYPLDLQGPDCKPPHSTGPLSFRHGDFPVGSLCTQQAWHHGTAWARGFIRTTCPCRSSISQTSLFPPEEEEKSFRLFPVDLHAIAEAFFLRV